jgi:Tfp pilus assembly protein PilW
MFACVIGTLILGAVLTTYIYMNRTLGAMANYEELDRQSRHALDVMTRAIRQSGTLTNWTSTSLAFTNLDGTLLSIAWDPATGNLTYINQYPPAETNVLLKDCTSLTFSAYQRTPISNTVMQFNPTLATTNTKVIVMDWVCARTNYMSSKNTESVQTAKVVLRN